ncbi:MAG: hypothetical protein NC111_00770 [Bacteroides sp.]|nr:hypothetical protein [Bacteroides sp.]
MNVINLIPILVLTLITFEGVAENKIDGIFYRSRLIYNDTIRISDGTLVLTTDEIPFNTNEHGVKALCRVETLTDNFIKLFSIDIPNILFDDMSITYHQETNVDSTIMYLNFPNLDVPVEISIDDLVTPGHPVLFLCCDQKCKIKIPKWFSKIILTISPKTIIESSIFGTYYGLVSFTYLKNPIEIKSDKIEITFPNVKQSILRRWYFNGNIIQVENNKLYFRDQVYDKIE